MSTRTNRLLTAAAIVGALALAGCTAPPPPGTTLPGPVPDGVEYHEVDPAAYPDAPDAEVTLLDGTAVSLSDLWADRPVLLFFTESWCELCVTEQDELDDIVDEFGDAVTVVALAEQSDAEQLAQYARDHGVTHLVARDPSGAAWKSYAVEEPPFLAVIGPEGKLLRGWRGAMDDLDGAVDALLVKEHPSTE